MPHEQNRSGKKLAIVTLSAIELPIIKDAVAKIAAALNAATAGTITRVECGAFNRRRGKPVDPSLG